MINFQNCAPSKFNNTSSSSTDAKLGTESPVAETPADADNSDGKDVVRDSCGDLGKNAQWVLISANLDKKNLVLPDNYKFAFAVHKNPEPDPRVCTGDCGIVYKQNVHSYSGSLDAEYSCRWDEKSGQYTNTFFNDQTLADLAAKLASGSDDKATDGLVVSHLKGTFTIKYTSDYSVMTLTFANGDIMSFAHHNSAIFF